MIGIIALFFVFGQLASSAPTMYYPLTPDPPPSDDSRMGYAIEFPNWYTTKAPKYVPRVSSNMYEGLMTKLGSVPQIYGLSEYDKMMTKQLFGTKNLSEMKELAVQYDSEISNAKRKLNYEREEFAPKDPEEIDEIWKDGILKNEEITGNSQDQMLEDDEKKPKKTRNNLWRILNGIGLSGLKSSMDYKELAEERIQELIKGGDN